MLAQFSHFGMILITAALGLIVLGILVLVHEAGHFFVAKACGIRVLTFSIGFGKSIISWTKGGTKYSIGSIPFGGYVKMAGEYPEDGRAGAGDEFYSKPVYQRALVAVAGPAANVVFAVLCLWVAFQMGMERPVYLDSTVVGDVADSSVAARAGIRTGDTILSIDGKAVAQWDNIEMTLAGRSGKFTLLTGTPEGRKDIVLEIPAIRGTKMSASIAGMQSAPDAIIGAITPNGPAELAGLKKGDRIITIDSTHVWAWPTVSRIIGAHDSAKGPLTVTVLRGSDTVICTVVPKHDATAKRMLVGIQMASPATRIERFGPAAALQQSFAKNWEYGTMVFTVFDRLFKREVSVDQLSGPIGIVQMSGAMALMGMQQILNFMALIGINLAVMNLLPLVITDGGVLLFLLIEAIRRKPLSLQTQGTINKIAIILLISLFLYITFNDVKRAPELYRLFGK